MDMKRLLIPGLILLGACSPAPDDPLVVQILNTTGRDLIGFHLEGGGSLLDVELLQKGAVFKSPFRVKTPGPLKLRYDGQEQSVDFKLGPEHNVAELRITLRAGGPPELFFRPIRRQKPSDTAAGNLSDARRLYDLLDPGMPGATAMDYLGQGALPKPDWGVSRDYGSSQRPETVTLGVEVKAGRVARVYLQRAGKILSEKK